MPIRSNTGCVRFNRHSLCCTPGGMRGRTRRRCTHFISPAIRPDTDSSAAHLCMPCGHHGKSGRMEEEAHVICHERIHAPSSPHMRATARRCWPLQAARLWVGMWARPCGAAHRRNRDRGAAVTDEVCVASMRPVTQRFEPQAVLALTKSALGQKRTFVLQSRPGRCRL